MFDLDDSKNVWDRKIKEIFNTTENSVEGSSLLWQIVNLILYESYRSTELVELYRVLDKKQFIKMVQTLDGREFKPPTNKELQEALLTAVFYYEKEINNKSWKEIQDSMNFEISPRKYGIKVRNLSNFLEQKIQELLRKGE